MAERVDLVKLENVIKQALPMTMRNESPCEGEPLLQEVEKLRAMKLAVHDLAGARLEGQNIRCSFEMLAHDMREIERLTR